MANTELQKQPTFIAICVILCLLMISGCQGMTKGRDFLVSFFEMFEEPGTYTRFIGFLSEGNTVVHVRSVGFGGVTDDIPVNAGELKRYGIDHITTSYRANLEVNDMCYRITSDDDIQVFGYHTGIAGGDIYIALPTPVLSTKYFLATYKVYEKTPTHLSYTLESQTAFLIMAPEDNTQVTITLRMNGLYMAKGCGNGTFHDGETKTYILNKNEVIGAYCGDDITGSVVESDKPVAVLSGNNYEYVILAGGPLVEMMLPVNYLGVNYVVFPPPNQAEGILVRVIGSTTSTSVRTSQGQTFPLNEGEFVELVPFSDPLYLESDKPIMVAQITRNNPNLLIVPSTNLFARNYEVGKAEYYVAPLGVLNDNVFYVSVIVPTDKVLGIEPDIFPQFTVIENSCFSYSSAVLDYGLHQVYHVDDIQFGMVVYPYSYVNMTVYAYAAGYNFTDAGDKATCPVSLACDDGNPFPCSCSTGYFVYQCDDTSQGCVGDPCQYTSGCQQATNTSYTCECVNGTGGAHCEHDITDDCINNTCVNGTCEDGIYSYTCNCTAGFEGVYCDTDIDECANNPCVNGTCTNLLGTYNCSCTPGFEGVNCEIETDECSSNPCINGTCNNLIDMYNCSCTPGFEGVNCETDIDECSSNPCVNGTCNNHIDMYNCTCTAGYEGVNCEIDIDECASNPCVNGTCNHFIDMYNCTCTAGFEGINCEIDIDECASSPCVNGTCNNLIDMYNCTCTPGFEGVNCEIDINECGSNPCENGGTCTDLIDAFSCACVPGYNGNVCETDIDECSSNPCVNGTCNNFIDMYNCTCTAGFEGENCEIDIDECSSKPCINGTCNNLINMYNCSCTPGFEGVNCETEINECDSGPCANGGTCTDLIDAFSCACVPGYSDIMCETDIDECSSNPCVNGTCNNHIDMYNCTCTAGYEGVNCEIDIDECASNPCVNGTCNNFIDMYNCSCAVGFEGVNCEIEINECASAPCQNGGNCNDLIGYFDCACVAGYAGSMCETDVDECASSPCENGGNCSDLVDGYNCTCPVGVEGDNCEIVHCSADPCENNATCVDSPGGFSCTCIPGFVGARCDVDVDECSSDPCKNSGSCNDLINAFECLCPANFSGILCEILINCGCGCYLTDQSDEELTRKIAWIRSLLYLDKNTLSKQVRTKISIPDERPVSKGIGYTGVVCIVVAFGFFFFMDGLTLMKVVTKKPNVIQLSRPEVLKTDSNVEKEKTV